MLFVDSYRNHPSWGDKIGWAVLLNLALLPACYFGQKAINYVYGKITGVAGEIAAEKAAEQARQEKLLSEEAQAKLKQERKALADKMLVCSDYLKKGETKKADVSPSFWERIKKIAGGVKEDAAQKAEDAKAGAKGW
jgi:hypothetical protein